jgi:hypothetical protein
MAELRIYIAGPLTGKEVVNTKKAIEAGIIVMKNGDYPFIPHLGMFCDLVERLPYETWMEWCLNWVVVSDAVLRLPGESKGADEEVHLAKTLKIPVFYSMEEYEKYSNNTVN